MKNTQELREEIIKLRENGLSYDEIGQKYGVSRQRIYQIVKVAGADRIRKNNTNIERIVYKGVYEFMKDNSNVSYASLSRAIGISNSSVFQRFLQSTSDNGRPTIRQIKKLIEITGKSFEELFERRD